MTRVTKKRTKKITNRIQAIWVAAPAIPDKPKRPAINPMTRKVMLQLNINDFSFSQEWFHEASLFAADGFCCNWFLNNLHFHGGYAVFNQT